MTVLLLQLPNRRLEQNLVNLGKLEFLEPRESIIVTVKTVGVLMPLMDPTHFYLKHGGPLYCVNKTAEG